MVIQMTKKEYQAKYGVAPTISNTPIKMTRQEYNEKYGNNIEVQQPEKETKGTLLSPLKEGISGLKTLYGGGEQGIANKLKTNIQEASSDIQKGNVLKGITKAGLRTAGDVAGAVYAPVGALFNATGIGKATDWIGNKIANSSLGNKITDIPAVQKFAMKHPNAGEDFGRALNLGFAGMEKGKIETKTVIPRTKMQAKNIIDTSSKVVKNLTTQSEKQIEGNILKKYEKGVKPLINAKMTPNKLEKYRGDVVKAVKTIGENKQNLKFKDVDGIEITGKSPKTLQQLADSVEQTKKSIFKSYDTLAKQAGDAGIKIKTKPIASELDSVINNKALQLTNPNAIKYAKMTKARYNQIGELDAVTVQDVIQNYNKSLEAFYRNPSYDNASNATIDAMIANNLRKALDEGITGLTGSQYSTLKKQYGSLKSIEKDVIKASLRDARKSTKGLIDFTDIFSGGQIVNGILSLNPAQIASGLTQKGIATYYKYLNNPNRAIESLFSSVEKLPQLNLSKNFQTTKAIKPNIKPPKNPISKTIPQTKPKANSSLISKAKKYDSAEKFVKSQGEPLFHGTYRDSFGGKITYFIPNKQQAKDFAKVRTPFAKIKTGLKEGWNKKLNLVEVRIDPNAKIKDIDFKPGSSLEFEMAKMRDAGYDAVRYNEPSISGKDRAVPTIAILNKDVIKTKSQLTDIWKKAQGKLPSKPPRLN